MKKLPIGIQNINELLEENYVYVDKTEKILELIETGKHYFISRPRRFGKSLLLSTLAEIFQGKKRLFKECKIYKSNYNWPEHEVLHFDFSRIPNDTTENLDIGLKETIRRLAKNHGISIDGSSIQLLLENLIEGLAQKNRVVVLVDEYDKPIIDRLKTIDIAEKNRDLLKGFFTALKSMDKFLKFSFITGVSKFSQVSLFSGPNNLDDITLDPKFSSLMGYTHEELKTHFKDHIQALAERLKQSDESIVLSELKEWYNGYCFSEDCELVYNPFSTLLYFKKQKAHSYWFNTGTPSFLIDQIRKTPQSVISLSKAAALRNSLSDISDFDNIDFKALMFQTGYLTIKKYYPEEDCYQLDFPNREVRQAFFDSLIQEFAKINPMDIANKAKSIRSDLENYHFSSFIQHINQHFAKIPYMLFAGSNEGFYHAIFLTFLERSGIKTSSEVATNIGRIDLVAEMPKTTIVFELKLNQTADVAFNQTQAKNYQEKFSLESKEIVVIGINFSTESHNISDWCAKLFTQSGNLIKDL